MSWKERLKKQNARLKTGPLEGTSKSVVNLPSMKKRGSIRNVQKRCSHTKKKRGEERVEHGTEELPGGKECAKGWRME